MQRQTTGAPAPGTAYTVEIDRLGEHVGIPALTIPAPCSAVDIVEAILAHAAQWVGVYDVEVTVSISAGTVSISDTAAEMELGAGTITGPGVGPEPDYWSKLADQLRQVADQLGTLAGSGLPAAVSARVTLAVAHTFDSRAELVGVAAVDAIAARLGLTATTGKAVGLWAHAAQEARDPLTVDVYCSVPAPVSPELVEARTEIERLRAEIAAQPGGGL